MKQEDSNGSIEVPGTAYINRRARTVSFAPWHRRSSRANVTARGRMTISECNELEFEPLKSLRSEAVVKHRTAHGSLSRTKLGRMRITFEFDLTRRATLSLELEEEMQDMANFVFAHFDAILI